MAKDSIASYSATAASNTDVGGVGIAGTNAISNADDALREIMSHLKEMSAGTNPVEDTMTWGDPADLTKRYRLDGGSITAGQTRVLTVPDSNGTLLTTGNSPTLGSLEGLTLGAGDMLYATAADTLTDLAIGTAGQFLVTNAGATAPEWASRPTLASLEGLSLVAGDVLYATAADTLARLPKGTAAQLLAMNAGATAPEWVAAPTSFAYTLTSLGTVNTTSGTTQSITGLATTYKALFLAVDGVSSGSVCVFRVAFSSNNGSSYGTVRQISPSTPAAQTSSGWVWLYNTGNNGASKIVAPATTESGTGSLYSTTAIEATVTGLIDAIQFSPSAGSFDAGSITVYGVS